MEISVSAAMGGYLPSIPDWNCCVVCGFDAAPDSDRRQVPHPARDQERLSRVTPETDTLCGVELDWIVECTQDVGWWRSILSRLAVHSSLVGRKPQPIGKVEDHGGTQFIGRLRDAAKGAPGPRNHPVKGSPFRPMCRGRTRANGQSLTESGLVTSDEASIRRKLWSWPSGPGNSEQSARISPSRRATSVRRFRNSCAGGLLTCTQPGHSKTSSQADPRWTQATTVFLHSNSPRDLC